MTLTHVASPISTRLPIGPSDYAPVSPRRIDDKDSSGAARARLAGRERIARRALSLPVDHLPLLLMLLAVGDLFAAASGVALAGTAGVPLAPTIALLVPPAWLACLAATRSYELRGPLAGVTETVRRLLRAGIALALIGAVASTVVDPAPTAGQLLLLTGAVAAISMAPRLGARLVAARAGAAARTRVVVAGRHPREVHRVLTELRRAPHPALDVVSVCLPRPPKRTAFDVPVALGLDRLGETASATDADAVIVLPCDHLDETALRRIGWQLEQSGTRLLVGTPLLDVATSRTTLTQAAGLRMVHVRSVRGPGAGHVVKSLVERPLAALLLLMLAPLLLTVWALVRWDSEGPAIYRQSRVGRHDRGFTMFKFRTMSVGADRAVSDLSDRNESNDVLFKIRQDPRVTRVGAVLRKYSLDELPQLVNVLLGHMSLVGPRPALATETAQYDFDARRRLAVKPGLTGLWQVSGRSDLSWEDTVRLDVRYVDNWSLALDLAIMCRTVTAVLTHRGAY